MYNVPRTSDEGYNRKPDCVKFAARRRRLWLQSVDSSPVAIFVSWLQLKLLLSTCNQFLRK